MRRLLYALVAVALAFGMRAPAALAFSPELSLDYWWSRIAREDRAGDPVTHASRSLHHLATRLDLDLTSRLALASELVAPADRLAVEDVIDGGSEARSTMGYALEATFRLPVLGAAVGPAYLRSVLEPEAGAPAVEVDGWGGVARGVLSVSDRVRLEGSVRHLPGAQVRRQDGEQAGSYTDLRVGASVDLWEGLHARAAYRQGRAVVPNPAPGVLERTYQQGGYALGLGYRF